MKKRKLQLAVLGIALIGVALLISLFVLFKGLNGNVILENEEVTDIFDEKNVESEEGNQFEPLSDIVETQPGSRNDSRNNSTSGGRSGGSRGGNSGGSGNGGGGSGGNSNSGNGGGSGSVGENNEINNGSLNESIIIENIMGESLEMLFSSKSIMINGNKTVFEFNLSNLLENKSCDFYVDNKFIDNLSNLVSNVYSFTYEIDRPGKHSWSLNCGEGLVGSYDFKAYKMSNFRGRSTDLLNIKNLSRVGNFILEKQNKGLIEFLEPVDLSRGLDFDSIVSVSENFIRVDSLEAPELNVSARLTFFNSDLTNPVILRDGNVCSDCEIISNGNELVFLVNHFTNYTSSENSQLEIFDDSDSLSRFANDQLYFYANYTNITDSSAIQGGGTFCNITIEGESTELMTFNATSGLYYYNRSFSNAGLYPYTVECHGAPLGFTYLTGGDDALVSPAGNSYVRGANVSVVSVERAQADAASPASAYSGNITEMVLTGVSTTQTWQGFFGNVSGAIELSDGGGNILYNWTLANPEGEIYATIRSSISWTDVQCFNFTAEGDYTNENGNGGSTSLYGTNLTQLESDYSIAFDDVDGVDETFSLLGSGTHDLFYLASNEFSEGECRNTRVYGDTGSEVDNEFEEVLLYDPVTRGIIFSSLIEEASVLGFNDLDHDFEMLVLEDGHGSNVASTPYYFFVELE